MANRFFTDDIPNIPDNNGQDNNSNRNDNNKFSKIYGTVVGIIGIIVFGGAMILLFQSDLLKKNKPIDDSNKTNESHSLTDNDNELPSELIISKDIKNKLDEYCSLVDKDGNYVSSDIDDNVDKYEMCSKYQCMTTVEEETGITYYFKDCKASKDEYKKMTKEELDVTTFMDEACSSLDEKGNYSNVDIESNSSIVCESYSCDLTYNGKEYHQSCLS